MDIMRLFPAAFFIFLVYVMACWVVTVDDNAPRKITGTCGACTWELLHHGRTFFMLRTYDLVICPTQDVTPALLDRWDDVPPWHGDLDRRVARVMIAPGVKAATCKKMFSGFDRLRIAHVSGLDTSDVKSMSCMFRGCKALKNLDLSSLNTSNVTDMSFMFDGCHAEITLDVTMWRPRGKNAEKMFSDCKPPRLLDVSTGAISVVEWLRRPTSGGE